MRAMYILYNGFGTVLARVELRCSARWYFAAQAGSQLAVEFEDLGAPVTGWTWAEVCLFALAL